MSQERMKFDGVAEDPAWAAEQETIWWLVNRIRTRDDAAEAFRVARNCLRASLGPKEAASPRVKLQAALGLVADAIDTWDDPAHTDADKLQVWDTLDAQLARRAREPIRADRAACIHYGRLLFAALRSAYGIQKFGNQAAARWRTPGKDAR